MSRPAKILKFEQAMGQLEKMVEKLEAGDLSLEESLKVFEEGMELTKFCEQKIEEAEGKVEMLMKDRGPRERHWSERAGAESHEQKER
ncbi:MAG: exodeoxyribonuclease VII small subunit [Deltaproteobacteria bacterium]|nr:exodeoxyribonuclease VII small subunit [Deltaproteobacteria bacterium]